MKNLILRLSILAFAACQNVPKNGANSENPEKRDPSVFEQKTTALAVETMPDSLAKSFMRKPPPKVVARLIYSPPFVVEEGDGQPFIPPTVSQKPPHLGLDSVKSIPKTLIPRHFFQDFEKKSQFFILNTPAEANEEPSETIVVTGREGTKLTIGKDVFETENRQNTEGSIRLELKEFYTLEDIIAADLTTQSDGEMLETGGMIYLSATDSKGQKLKIKSGKSIRIEMPRLPNSSEKQLFYGEKQGDSPINWRLAPIVKGEFGLNAYTVVDQNPEFPDGQKAMLGFINKTIKYPLKAYLANAEGTVYVGFVVNAIGEIQDVNIKRGLCCGLNEEAIRVVQAMPRWKAGRSNGNPVKVSLTLPIKFKKNKAIIADSSHIMVFGRDSAAIEDYRKEGENRLKIQEIETYVFNSRQLGWINCDRLLDNKKPKTNVVVFCDSENTDVKMIFKNTKSIISGWSERENYVTFANVPSGEPIYLVLTNIDKTGTKAAIIETITEKNQTLTPDLQVLTPKVFLEKLKTLTFNNQ